MGAAGSAALLAKLAPAATMPSKPMQGAFIILSTPYTSSKAVDWEDLAGEVDFMDRFGVNGLVWPQLSSELLQLSKDERMRGMEVLAKAVKGKNPVLILGVQGDDTKEMLEYASHAERFAPDGMIAIPPKKATSLADFREYFRALCQLTKRPIFIQTSGGAPNVVASVDFMLEAGAGISQLRVCQGRARSGDRADAATDRTSARSDQAGFRRALRERMVVRDAPGFGRHHHRWRDVWRHLRQFVEPPSTK